MHGRAKIPFRRATARRRIEVMTLVNLTRHVTLPRRTLEEHDSSVLRRVEEKEIRMDSERITLVNEMKMVANEREQLAREREQVQSQAAQLQRDLSAFNGEANALMQLSLEVKARSEQVTFTCQYDTCQSDILTYRSLICTRNA